MGGDGAGLRDMRSNSVQCCFQPAQSRAGVLVFRHEPLDYRLCNLTAASAQVRRTSSRISRMIRLAPAVVIHSAADARAVLALGRPVTLVSAAGAALFMGAGWWVAMMGRMRSEYPDAAFVDLLDCGDAPGRAAEALRAGQRHLVLQPEPPALFERVRLMAEEVGAVVLPAMPETLDLARPGARRQLADWLAAPA